MVQMQIFKNGELFANCPTPHVKPAQVPSDVWDYVRNYWAGANTTKKWGIWSWSFQEKG